MSPDHMITHDHAACAKCLPDRLAALQRLTSLGRKKNCDHTEPCACVKVRKLPISEQEAWLLLSRSQ
jgi:hypothetical protein